MIKLNEMLFKQRIEISPQIVCGKNNVIILHINDAGIATKKQGLITFLSNSFILMIETIRTAVYATGNITKFMIWPEAIYLLVLPISYYAGIITNDPNALIIAMVLYEIFVCTIRVWIASKEA